MLSFRSAPERTKNAMKIGGVSRSAIVMTLSLSLEMFAKTAPIAMHVSRSEKPNVLETNSAMKINA